MRVLLIGHRGQLGSDLKQVFASEDLVLAGRDNLPVQDHEAVGAFVQTQRPDLILNCSAFHRVDDCEDQPGPAFDIKETRDTFVFLADLPGMRR